MNEGAFTIGTLNFETDHVQRREQCWCVQVGEDMVHVG